MLNSTFELITLAASNSLMVFCFFNLIIVVLLVGSSKPVSSHSNDQSIGVIPSTCDDENKKKDSVFSCEMALSELGEVSLTNKEMINEEETNQGEDEDDDDLMRRVEEFIQKINKGWRDERKSENILIDAMIC